MKTKSNSKLNFLILFTFVLFRLSEAQNRLPNPINPCMYPFYHGVASGDPKNDRVIIWTRVTPDNLISSSIQVNWLVATDTAMSNIVQQGVTNTDSTIDYTVKVDVTGLSPNTYYYYEFNAFGYNSIRGRTKTAPDNSADSIRFAVVSCSNFEAGYFNAYKVITSRNDVDAVICLGDYIYEYETGGYSPNPSVNRQWLPANEIVTLSDYRARYSSYKLDEDLMRCHQNFPFINIWDDHESANDAWVGGAENHTASTEGNWNSRKDASKKAYFEWLPIRQSTNTNDQYQIFREIKFGNLLELIMLDTRLHGREEQAGTSGTVVNNVNRQLLGSDQFSWLGNRLSGTNTQWKIIAQQVMIAPLTIFGSAVNGDQWDGYPAERNRLINHILNNNIQNVVALTGDIHSSWANDIPTANYNSTSGSGSAFVEFVTPSVTSPGINIVGGASAVMLNNGHIKFANLNQHGFLILDVNQTRTQSDWYFLSTIDQPSLNHTAAASFKVNNLTRKLVSASSVSLPRTSLSTIQPPLCPRVNNTTSLNFPSKQTLINFFPVPVNDKLVVQYSLNKSSEVYMQVIDISGKIIFKSEKIQHTEGVHTENIFTSDLQNGTYTLQIIFDNGTISKKFVK
jgi:alkaline phosphatase D